MVTQKGGESLNICFCQNLSGGVVRIIDDQKLGFIRYGSLQRFCCNAVVFFIF